MKSLSQQNTNKSAARGAQLVPIGIPTTCLYIFVTNLINILSKENGEHHTFSGTTTT